MVYGRIADHFYLGKLSHYWVPHRYKHVPYEANIVKYLLNSD